jgi:hypothetical protein
MPIVVGLKSTALAATMMASCGASIFAPQSLFSNRVTCYVANGSN